MRIASNADNLVFDPFMGVGSTGVATLKLDRRFSGVGIEEDYYRAAEKRLSAVETPLFTGV